MRRSYSELGGMGCLFCLLLACGDMDSKPEVADKLKPVLIQLNVPEEGAAYNPPSWGETATLTIHLIGPESQGEIGVRSEAAEPAPLSVPLGPLTVGTPTSQSYPGLKHFVVKATVAIPSAEEWARSPSPELAQADLIRLRYRVLVSDGTRELPIVGDFPAYRSDEIPSAGATVLGSRIVSPQPGLQAGNELEIQAEINKSQEEPVKVGWYVSAGEIQNRRAASTRWTVPGPGPHTLVMTVRGKNSRTGAIAFSQVQIP